MIRIITTNENGQVDEPLPLERAYVVKKDGGWWIEWVGQVGASGGFSLDLTGTKSVEFKGYDPDDKAGVESADS